MTDQVNGIMTSTMSLFERNFKFYFLLIMHIPSICCTCFILYHFKWNRLVSQIFGILLVVNGLLIVAEIPFTLMYLHQGMIFNTSLCPGWILVNYILFILSIILTAWTSIERYLFIYHEHFIIRHQILLHYTPVVLFTLYTPSFYVALVIFYPCQQAFSEYNYICGGPCYLFEIVPCLIDWGINVLVVLLVTCIVNILLITRNMAQRHRMKRSIVTIKKSQQWRRTVKLSVQLFSISILCMLGWIPYGIVSAMQIFHNTDFLTYILSAFFIFLPYLQTLFLPYACLLFMPEIKNKLLIIWSTSYCFKIIYRKNQIHAINEGQTNILTRANLAFHQRTFVKANNQ